MIWNDVLGRGEQVEMFRRSIRRGRLASAYLFAGPEGVGKRLFARRLAQCIFCDRLPADAVDACGECGNCRQMEAGSHPDFLFVGFLEGKRELLIEQFVGTADRRGREGLCHDLSLRPMSAARKIAVIDDASMMNDASANALLKTLEEPPSYALLILLATNADSLLQTIRSRCQLVRFPGLSQADVESLLLAHGLSTDPAEARAVAALSDGSLATASQLLDPQLRGLRDRLYASLAADQFQSVATAKEINAAIDDLGGDGQTQRKNALWTIRFAVEFFRDVLRSISIEGGSIQEAAAIPQASQAAGRLDATRASTSEGVMAVIERLGSAADQIDRMAPLALCIEGLCDDIGRLLRSAAATK